MKSVGGSEPMATHRANGPTRVTDADPLEQPSLPLTTSYRQVGPAEDWYCRCSGIGVRPPRVTRCLTCETYAPWIEVVLKETEIVEGEPPHVPAVATSSVSLSPTDRESVQADLDQQRELLERHANTEPLTGMVAGWSKRYWMFVREIARLERMLEEDA